MTHEVKIITNNILELSYKDETLINPMKLQKIIFFVALHYIKVYKRPLFSESFETWAYGPVLLSLHNYFKPYGSNVITDYAKDAVGDIYIFNLKENPILESIIKKVWEVTKNFTPAELARMTQAKGSAWDKAYQQDLPIINDEDMLNDNSYENILVFS